MSSSVIFYNFIHNFLIILSEATIKERMTEQLLLIRISPNNI